MLPLTHPAGKRLWGHVTVPDRLQHAHDGVLHYPVREERQDVDFPLLRLIDDARVITRHLISPGKQVFTQFAQQRVLAGTGLAHGGPVAFASGRAVKGGTQIVRVGNLLKQAVKPLHRNAAVEFTRKRY